MISGITLTISGAEPTVAVISTTSSTKSSSAVSVSSYSLVSTAISTYYTCDGGYSVSLSTSTNAAKSTFLVYASDPPLTISTITPTPISTSRSTIVTSTKSSPTAEPTATGFVIAYVSYSSVIYPIGVIYNNDRD